MPKRNNTILAQHSQLALTIRQPWAWAIMAGFKTVENRSWKTSVRGRILVHAGRLDDELAIDSFLRICERLTITTPPFRTLPTRVIVGSVEITNCLPVEKLIDPWAFGPWCFLLRDPQPRQTIVSRGFARFWRSDVEHGVPTVCPPDEQSSHN